MSLQTIVLITEKKPAYTNNTKITTVLSLCFMILHRNQLFTTRTTRATLNFVREILPFGFNINQIQRIKGISINPITFNRFLRVAETKVLRSRGHNSCFCEEQQSRSCRDGSAVPYYSRVLSLSLSLFLGSENLKINFCLHPSLSPSRSHTHT